MLELVFTYSMLCLSSNVYVKCTFFVMSIVAVSFYVFVPYFFKFYIFIFPVCDLNKLQCELTVCA